MKAIINSIHLTPRRVRKTTRNIGLQINAMKNSAVRIMLEDTTNNKWYNFTEDRKVDEKGFCLFTNYQIWEDDFSDTWNEKNPVPLKSEKVELSTFNLCVPPVVIATSFAALKKIPVSVSPVLVIDGALAEPAANDATDVIVGAARVTTDAVALNPDVKSLPSPRRV